MHFRLALPVLGPNRAEPFCVSVIGGSAFRPQAHEHWTVCGAGSYAPRPPMRELPAGTVTFLFTDIEGSTRLLHQLGDAYAGVLADHRRLLRDAFARHEGVEVDTQGDSFFVAFADPREAIAAAAEAQTVLARHAWPDAAAVRVRMGLHTGEPLVADDHYVG